MRPIIGRKIEIVYCVFLCVCVRACVKGILSLIRKYLSFQFNYLWKWVFWNRKKISLLSIHRCFSILGLRKPPPLPCQNFGVFGTSKRNMLGLNVKELPNHINLRETFFCFLGLRTNQKKTFKSYLEETETAVCYKHKKWFKLRFFISS